MEVLDKNGLTYFYNKIKSIIDSKASFTGLDDKTLYIIGDSVNYGAGWENSGGFEKLIQETYPACNVLNLSVGGTTLANKQIINQFLNYGHASNPPDIILMDGGGNDFLQELNFGSYDLNSFSLEASSYDPSTTYGALELSLAMIQLAYPNCKIFLFGLYKLFSSEGTGSKSYDKQRVFWDDIRKICEKWSVIYIDFFNSSTMGLMQINTYTSDGIHLNEAGYRRLWPMVNDCFKKHLN